jgi:hypothetical protein
MHCWPRCACIPSFITTLLMHDVVRHGWMRARTWGAHAPCVARVAARGRGRANPVVGILSRACLRVVCFKRMRSGRPEPSSIKSFVTREHRRNGGRSPGFHLHHPCGFVIGPAPDRPASARSIMPCARSLSVMAAGGKPGTDMCGTHDTVIHTAARVASTRRRRGLTSEKSI